MKKLILLLSIFCFTVHVKAQLAYIRGITTTPFQIVVNDIANGARGKVTSRTTHRAIVRTKGKVITLYRDYTSNTVKKIKITIYCGCRADGATVENQIDNYLKSTGLFRGRRRITVNGNPVDLYTNICRQADYCDVALEWPISLLNTNPFYGYNYTETVTLTILR